MMRTTVWGLVIVAGMLSAPDALAINKCKDANGRMTYSDQPCPAGTANLASEAGATQSTAMKNILPGGHRVTTTVQEGSQPKRTMVEVYGALSPDGLIRIEIQDERGNPQGSYAMGVKGDSLIHRFGDGTEVVRLKAPLSVGAPPWTGAADRYLGIRRGEMTCRITQIGTESVRGMTVGPGRTFTVECSGEDSGKRYTRTDTYSELAGPLRTTLVESNSDGSNKTVRLKIDLVDVQPMR